MRSPSYNVPKNIENQFSTKISLDIFKKIVLSRNFEYRLINFV
jgi:hypothetical protein